MNKILSKISIFLLIMVVAFGMFPITSEAASKITMKVDTKNEYYSHGGQVAFKYGVVSSADAKKIATIFDSGIR